MLPTLASDLAFAFLIARRGSPSINDFPHHGLYNDCRGWARGTSHVCVTPSFLTRGREGAGYACSMHGFAQRKGKETTMQKMEEHLFTFAYQRGWVIGNEQQQMSLKQGDDRAEKETERPCDDSEEGVNGRH